MNLYSQLSNTERSEYFRHPHDFQILERSLTEKKDLPANILMIGVANMEEPLSVLTVANKVSFQREMQLSDLVSVNFVEKRSRDEIIPEYSLGMQLKGGMSLLFAPQEQISSMELEPRRPHYVREYPEAFVIEDRQYRFSNQIIDFLNQQMQRESTRFSTSLQEFLEEPQNHLSDYIFCNNVFQYIDNGDKASLAARLIDLLKPNGIIFLHYSKILTDTKGILGPTQLLTENPSLADRLETIKPAIYRRR